ncbi:MAG: hypothetical protein ACTS6G_04880 [Candidatus Hodgkinia cicadicola]
MIMETGKAFNETLNEGNTINWVNALRRYHATSEASDGKNGIELRSSLRSVGILNYWKLCEGRTFRWTNKFGMKLTRKRRKPLLICEKWI